MSSRLDATQFDQLKNKFDKYISYLQQRNQGVKAKLV